MMSLVSPGAQKYFSFAEIIQGRDAVVRVTPDGLLYAVDLVMVMTGKILIICQDLNFWFLK